MATTIVEPVMNLILPTPGINGDPGPDYANNQNQDLLIIASHTHGPGSGVPVTPIGLNINTNLPFNGNNATSIYGVQFSAPASSSLLTFLYTAPQSGGGMTDLFFNDGVGNVIALTKAGLVNATIASLPGESYSGGTFTWVQGNGSTTPANFDIGSVTIRPNTAGTANGVVVGPPSGISSLYNLLLPLVPVSTSFVQLDSSGNMSATIPINQGLSPSNFTSATQNQLAATGDIKMTGSTSVQAGWLLCDGTSYLIASFPALAAALLDSSTGNYAYGSADSTHFNVPEMRGMFPRGVGGATGNDPDAASRGVLQTGGNSGNNIGSVQGPQIQSHNHFMPGGNNASIGGTLTIPAVTGVTSNNFSGSTGGNQTNPINVYVNFLIKT